MIKRAMIDLETLGTKPGCVVLQIGIVCNFPSGLSDETSDVEVSMPVRLDIEQCLRAVDPNTVAWWMRHPDAWARQCFLQRDSFKPEYAAKNAFFLLSVCEEVWANSPSFDCAILLDFIFHFAPYEKIPWHYGRERDFRTVRALHSELVYCPPADAHDALADARAQAAYLDQLGIWRS